MFWPVFNSLVAIWLTTLLWLIWQVRGVLINVALSPVRRGMAVLWRRLSLDSDDLE